MTRHGTAADERERHRINQGPHAACVPRRRRQRQFRRAAATTTITYRAGIIAADSRETWEGEAGGTSYATCEKLFRKKIGKKEFIIGTAGGTYLAMIYVDWFRGIEPTMDQHLKLPEILRDAHLEEDFEVLIVCRDGAFHANHLCRAVKVIDPFIAIGSGRKAALGAMHAGATAKRAVEIACKVDPYTAPPVRTMRL